MEKAAFRIELYLPAQGASETEATIIEWFVGEGDRFQKGQALAQIDSAKSVYEFDAPCDGMVIRRFHLDGETALLTEPVMEIETSDASMKDAIPPAVSLERLNTESRPVASSFSREEADDCVILGVGAYLPDRVVTNTELAVQYPDLSEDYIFQVTGIRERRWAAEDEKPSDMALKASLDAIREADIATKDIDAIILATTTPDAAMPSTACILQNKLSLHAIPAFDLNAACSGWLYAVAMARGMIRTGMAKNVLTVGVDQQSRLLESSDRSTHFIFGDGAGAAIISAGKKGHRIKEIILGADTDGLRMARREQPGYIVLDGREKFDPWIRLDGHALFRAATENFAILIGDAIEKTHWTQDEVKWVVPHQANARIIKAAAKRSGLPFDRFVLNVDHVGNTSSASIPIALVETESQFNPDDKLILCTVGAGLTTAAVSVEW